MPFRQRILFVALLLAGFFLLLSSLAEGAWHRTQVTTTASESMSPRLVHDSSDLLHVFWEEDGEILHQIFGTPEIESIGPGHDLDISACPVCGDLSIAWIGSDSRPHFRVWDGGVWSETWTPFWSFGPTLGVAVSHHGEGRMLWGEHDPEWDNVAVLFAWKEDGAWSMPIELGRVELLFYPESVALSLRRTGTDGRMLASWVAGEFTEPMGLMARSGDGANWDPVEPIYDWLAGPYSVDSAYPVGTSHFAGNGPQPACPCNVLLYVSGTEGSWSEPVEIGEGHYPAEMEWPQEMSVHVRNADDVPLVVWRHEAYEMLQLVDERLVLGRRDAGTWTYDYDLAVGRDAHDPDVSTSASGDVYVIWSDHSDGFVNLHLASTEALAGVPPLPEFVTAPQLSVYPNPTRDGTMVEWNRGGVVDPHLRVFDARGREVMSLRLPCSYGSANSLVTGAGCDRIWWEVTDRFGRPLPGGVYLLELSDDVRRLDSRRLVVIR